MAIKRRSVKVEIDFNPGKMEEKALIEWQSQFLNPGEQIKKILLGKALPPNQNLRDEVARLVKELLGDQTLQAARADVSLSQEKFLEEKENNEPISEDAIREGLLRAFD